MTYTAPTISGYNSTPPTDDGAATEANSVKWATIKNKIGDPLKNYIDGVSSAVAGAFTQLFLGDFEAKSADFTVGLTDDGKLFDCTSAITITFIDAATAGEGFKFAVFNNVAAGGAITCDGNSSETINNALTHSTPARFDVTIYVCTGTAWRAFFIKGSEGSSAERTVASATTCQDRPFPRRQRPR